MDPFPVRRTMADDALTEVTVTDVYDQAAGIGKEFEKLIESYGVEAVTDLMPKVIRALEQLEALASKYEKETHEISDLRYAVDKLENEKVEKNEERMRFEEEVVQIEESWQKESKDQLSLIARLQEENRRLRSNLTEQKQAVVEEVAAVTKRTEEKEIEVLTKLKDTVDKQREDLRKVGRELKQKNVDVEALQAQSERLVKINMELRRKNQNHRKHARTLIGEKVTLEMQLAEKEQQVTQVQEMMKEQENLEDPDLANDTAEEKVQKAEAEAEVEASVSMVTTEEGEDDGVEVDEDPSKLVDKLSLIGKIVIDKQDPNRPRFTLNELRTVLMERNELKAQLQEVEEELSGLRPKNDLDEFVMVDNNTNALSEELNNVPDNDDDDDEDEWERPVQGPINREPDEKLYPGKRPSGIRKFFSSFFSKEPDRRHLAAAAE